MQRRRYKLRREARLRAHHRRRRNDIRRQARGALCGRRADPLRVRCAQYLFGTKAIKFYQAAFAIVIVIGCVSPIDIVWNIADTFNGLMAIPNFVGLFALSGVVAKLTKEHFSDPAAMLEDEMYT